MNVNKLFDLSGKVAIVTGGGRGLGKQIAIAFAEAGASKIVLCSRNVGACQEVSDYLQSIGVKSTAIKCDVTKHADVQKVVDQTVAEYGVIDILVNNSGASWGASAEDMPLEAWQKVMNVNVTGVFLMSQAVGKVMLQQGYGKIINIASVAGLKGSDPQSMNAIGYNTSKGAVITFTKDLAVKWGPRGIHVNAIAPGFFPTKMTKGVLENGFERIIESTPLRRVGTDQDLKGAAVYLASSASDFVAGSLLVIDGGTHAK